jgi:hypothetical protein
MSNAPSFIVLAKAFSHPGHEIDTLLDVLPCRILRELLYFVKARSLVVKLRADSTDKKIPVRRHRPENHSGAILDLPVSLWQRLQYNVTFGHRQRSSMP